MNPRNHWPAKALTALLPIINEVRTLVATKRIQEARTIVKQAYPFGERRGYPYRVWCIIVRRYIQGLYRGKLERLSPDDLPLFKGAE